MATLRQTRFTAWDLSDQEEKEGSLLTDLSLKRIQNMQAEAAEKQSNLKVDLNNVGDFATEHAYLTGQIEFAQYLIDSHSAAVVQVNTQLSESK